MLMYSVQPGLGDVDIVTVDTIEDGGSLPGVDVGATGTTKAVAIGKGRMSGGRGAVGERDGASVLFAPGPHPTQIVSTAIAVMMHLLIFGI
ncbi:MAG: hypothetical protein SWK90_12940 [Chloroflexota bacterium]|nr:hypothetical protein [Chloroflexota bacterium]